MGSCSRAGLGRDCGRFVGRWRRQIGGGRQSGVSAGPIRRGARDRVQRGDGVSAAELGRARGADGNGNHDSAAVIYADGDGGCDVDGYACDCAAGDCDGYGCANIYSDGASDVDAYDYGNCDGASYECGDFDAYCDGCSDEYGDCARYGDGCGCANTSVDRYGAPDVDAYAQVDADPDDYTGSDACADKRAYAVARSCARDVDACAYTYARGYISRGDVGGFEA